MKAHRLAACLLGDAFFASGSTIFPQVPEGPGLDGRDLVLSMVPANRLPEVVHGDMLEQLHEDGLAVDHVPSLPVYGTPEAQ